MHQNPQGPNGVNFITLLGGVAAARRSRRTRVQGNTEMPAPDEVASRIPQWVRALLVGLAVVLATGAGLYAYRWYSQPRTMTLAAGSYDGEAVRLMSAIAGRLTRSGSHIRLKGSLVLPKEARS